MDIHPWTKYEIARLRDEERLQRAREHWLAREAREARRAELEKGEPARSISLLDWMLRRGVVSDRTPARTGA